MKDKLKKISDYEWEIPKSGNMLVPAKFFSSELLLKDVEETAVEQLTNVAQLPGIQKHALAMADMHSGYGFPIGGVAAFDMKEGIISPGGVGYDINCGVRFLVTDLKVKDFLAKRDQFLELIFKNVPCGVGKEGRVRLNKDQLLDVLKNGSKWAVKNGYGVKADLPKTEEGGCMDQADPSLISKEALQRGLPQIGSLGSGNHFLEVDKISNIFDKDAAKTLGIDPECVTVLIHCGSRGLGHQVASDYIKLMENKVGTKHLPDRQLVNAPLSSDIGQDYFKAMCAAANFAFTNRQMIMHWTRETFEKIYDNVKVNLMYDICHNICKVEEGKIDGKKTKVAVMRKGATRAFGPGHEELPKEYRKIGQPILIPGSMGTASYVLVGTQKAEMISFSSSAHGAGRVMSRHAALQKFKGETIKQELHDQNIELRSRGLKGIAEEAPGVYKDVDEVIRVTDGAGIGKKVVRVTPLAVIKG